MPHSNPPLAQHDLSRLGLFPLPNVVLFPSQLLSLHVFEPRYRRLVNDVIERSSVLAVPRLRAGFDAEYYGAPPVYAICGAGQITEYTRLPDGRFNLVVRGLGRVRLLEELRSEPYRVARAEIARETSGVPALVADTLRTELLKVLRRLALHSAAPVRELESKLRAAHDLAECSDIVAGTLVENADDRQALLDELDPMRRMTWLIAHVHGLTARFAGDPATFSRQLN